MYEDYPFWFTLFTRLGYRVELSGPSSKELYESAMASIPSDSLCYPAKLVQGHERRQDDLGIRAIYNPSINNERREDERADSH